MHRGRYILSVLLALILPFSWAFLADNAGRFMSPTSLAVVPPDLAGLQSVAADFNLNEKMSVGGFEVELKYLAGIGAATLALVLPSQLLVPKQLVNADQLSQIVEGTFLSNKNLFCAYKGSRDGWSAIDFHDKVDGRGSAVVVCRTRTGKVFGGFNPSGWRSTDDYYDSTAAFLWSLSSRVTKYPVLSGGSAAIFDYATGGPCFGSSDMLIGPPKAAIMGGFAGPDMENISTNAGDLRKTKVTPGLTYSTDRGWPVFGSPGLLEVEVYCNDGVGQQRASW